MSVSSMHFDTFKKLGERTSKESDLQVPQNHETLIQRNMSPSSLYDLDLHIAAPLDPKRYNKEFNDLSSSLMPQLQDRFNQE